MKLWTASKSKEAAPAAPSYPYPGVLRALDGHYIAGYGDGGDAPDKTLELLPGATVPETATSVWLLRLAPLTQRSL